MIFEGEFRLPRRSRHGPLQNQTRGSRLGSLDYDNITTYLHYLGEAVDVADIPVMLVVGHVEGRQVATMWRGGRSHDGARN